MRETMQEKLERLDSLCKRHGAQWYWGGLARSGTLTLATGEKHDGLSVQDALNLLVFGTLTPSLASKESTR